MKKIEQNLARQPLFVRILFSLLLVIVSLYGLFLIMSVIVPLIYQLGYLLGRFVGGLF